MADVFTKAKRSAVMSLIRSRGNRATELRLLALMRERGISGWRRNARVFGKPDFVFRRERIAVFVDGCFWHGCPRHATKPVTRAVWWAAKLTRNAQRDRAVTRALRASGWTVLRIWECALARTRAARTVARINRALAAAAMSAGPPLPPREIPREKI
jgi:DNA mismatch endonuclease (patch repair protein)